MPSWATGSFFGIDLSQQDWAFLAPVKHLFINENNYKPFGYAPMMVFSVCIGFVQVLLGMILAGVKAARNGGWKYGVGKFSWVVFLVTAVIMFAAAPESKAVLYILYGIIGLSGKRL